ncbi:MAG: exodeoxyribonuclease VII large subunit [Saprospiraceae bacterium]|nr:exodeoxyribonuclease VII large subunit [Saprospiraceae bacterium]
MSHTLFEINEFIRRVIALNLPEPLWVRAELADVKQSKGHYYLDLVQKGEGNGEIIAQAQAVIWQKEYRKLQKKIGILLDNLLQPGMEVLCFAKPEFHERYGLKLMVEDIDPAHTLGKLELQRRETIAKLQKLGLLDKNSRLPMPSVLQRIAVLSSEKAAGFQDFLKHLGGNQFGYRFKLDFYQVAVQGAMVEKEVMAQLEAVNQRKAEYDCAVIIRGGGARLDLAAFDSLPLAISVANMSLPVLVGIGHDVDETVLDLVAHTSLKTPTAVADFILHRNLEFESQMANLGLAVKNMALSKTKEQEQRLQNLSQLLDFQLKANFRRQAQMLDYIEKELPSTTKRLLEKQNTQLLQLEKLVRLLGPETAFQRGFAMVFHEGRQLTDASELPLGDEVRVQLKKGSFLSTVKSTKP